LALKTNGSIAAWDDLAIGSGAISKLTAITAEVKFALALKTNGTELE